MKSKKKESTKKENLINAKMSFAEVLQKYPETVDVFFKHGMSCFGCPAAMMENIEDGIKAHGEEVKKIIDELNAKIKSKK